MKLSASDTLPTDPLQLFDVWYEEAKACASIMYASAMCLSTVGPDGFPEGRIVLMHDFGADGFAFFTDRRSKKGRSLTVTPRAALTFYWGPLERQVRVQGPVESARADEADAFFAERPRRSKITAWASTQSTSVGNRAELEDDMEAVEQRFADREEIPRPPYWQAYRVVPRAIEFWQARARRLHDRIEYRASDEGWSMQRLAP